MQRTKTHESTKPHNIIVAEITLDVWGNLSWHGVWIVLMLSETCNYCKYKDNINDNCVCLNRKLACDFQNLGDTVATNITNALSVPGQYQGENDNGLDQIVKKKIDELLQSLFFWDISAQVNLTVCRRQWQHAQDLIWSVALIFQCYFGEENIAQYKTNALVKSGRTSFI